jgi:hypothetical protein
VLRAKHPDSFALAVLQVGLGAAGFCHLRLRATLGKPASALTNTQRSPGLKP